MKLLVITPTLGRSPWLDETVASVAALGGDTRHVIVCPESVAGGMQRRFPACAIEVERRPGLYRAINQVLSGSFGDWDAFTWLNDDDQLCVDGSLASASLLDQPAGADIVYGRVELTGRAGVRLGEIPVSCRPADMPSLLVQGIMPLAQPGTLIRRGTIDKIGLMDTSYRLAGDLDYFVRALMAGARFIYRPFLVAKFRLHEGQLSKNEADVAGEYRRAVAALPASGALGARCRFHWDNCRVYLERIRRHGFVSMKALYRHE